jgi:hypothetical protein
VLDLSSADATAFVEAIAQHRFWNRAGDQVPV